jgi:phage tail protein X
MIGDAGRSLFADRFASGGVMSRRQLLTVAGIVGLGVAAALPFARPRPQNLPAPVPIREAPLPELPLHLSTQSAPSPAIGLYDHDAPPQNPFTAPRIARSQLEDNGLPPELPERYHPLLEDRPPPPTAPPPTANLPPAPRPLQLLQPGTRATAKPDEPRTHRIVDGDTLAKIAERYWGNAALAEALWQANRDVLAAPDPLPLGVTLTIPVQPNGGQNTDRPHVEELPAPVKQPQAAAPQSPLPAIDLPLTPIPAGAFP